MDTNHPIPCILHEKCLAERIQTTITRSLNRRLWKRIVWRVGVAVIGFIVAGSFALESFRLFFPRLTELPFVIFLAVTLVLCPVITLSVRHVLKLLVDLQMAHLELLIVLGNTVAKRDQDTAEHNFRVAIMAVHLAEAAKLDTQSMLGQFIGAFLHDIGKIGISDRILLKPGSLSDDERQEMQKHVVHGIDILTNSVWLQEAARVIGFHHEKFDGSGYPHGLKSADIPVEARIFAIVDVFDALVSARPYKDAMPLEQALTVMQQENGKSFDPEYLCAFISIAERLHQQVIGLDLEQLKEMCATIIETYSGHWSARMVWRTTPSESTVCARHCSNATLLDVHALIETFSYEVLFLSTARSTPRGRKTGANF